MKKLKWAKPIVRDIGAELTEGQAGIEGACTVGKVYILFESCEYGTGALNKCKVGVGGPP